MSKLLEDFIKVNRAAFDDDLELHPEVWERIEKGIDKAGLLKKKEAKTFSLAFVLRVAAVIVLCMGLVFALYLKNQRQVVDYAAINPDYARQQVRYASLVQTKRTELKTLTRDNPQLYHEFSSVIAKMDSTYKALNNDLATSPNQERVLHAMIKNLQIQIQVLNQQLNAIEQFNEFKNKQKNGNESI